MTDTLVMIRIFWLGIALLVAYELFALWTLQPGDTISELVWTECRQRPTVPFAFGFLMGHFFW